MKSHNTFDVIVIGGGVAGLTAAYELSKHYSKILLIEKENELGGLVSSVTIGGITIERYYHHFFQQDLYFLNFLKELGLIAKVIWKESPTGYYFDNKIFNLNTPLEILHFPLLSLLDKLKLGFLLFKLGNISDFTHLDVFSAREWIIENTSRSVYKNFFQPLLLSKFGDDKDISAAWLCARIKKRSHKDAKGEKLGYLNGGLRIFFEYLEEKIKQKGEIIKRTSVDKIIIENNKVRGVFAGGFEYFANKVISTVGARALLKLCDIPAPLKVKLQEIKEQCVVCCIFGLARSLIKPYWLNIKSETLPFGILVEHNNFVNFNEYNDVRLVYAVTYCKDENNYFFKMDDTQVADKYLNALKDEFGLKPDEVLWWRVSRSNAAGPVYKKGFLKLIPGTITGIEGLYLAGMIRSYPDRGINESIGDAQDCVKIILHGSLE